MVARLRVSVEASVARRRQSAIARRLAMIPAHDV
jgi:hypothetical protein